MFDRAHRLQAIVDRELTDAQAPATRSVEQSKRTAPASFDHRQWALLVGPEPVGGSFDPPAATADSTSLDDAHALELASDVAHEARHGEQWFLAARYAASQGRAAADIATAAEIPIEIAQQAEQLKLDGATPQQRALAAEMHDAVAVDENKRHNRHVDSLFGYDELAAAAKGAVAARDALRAAPTTANLTAARQALALVHQRMVVVEAYYVAYRAIPYEGDASEVGDEAALAFELSR
ncbi:MAG TPA: hypothetical protein VHE35_32835 [Kofleriaceae bacterium]|nr:hypothetical protein [Kofleriaceae bacterium]